MNRENLLCAVLLTSIFSTSFALPAHAYLDCGTGAFIIQMILGGAMGVMVMLTRFRNQVGALLARITGRAPKESALTQAPTATGEPTPSADSP